MNIPGIVQFFLVLFGYNFNLPKSLRKDNRSAFDKLCDKIAPYIIFIAIITILILIVVITVKYGGQLLGTEANRFYNGGLV